MSKELFDLSHSIEMAEQIAANVDEQQEYQQMLDASVLETNDLLKELLEQYQQDSLNSQKTNQILIILCLIAAIASAVSAVAGILSLVF